MKRIYISICALIVLVSLTFNSFAQENKNNLNLDNELIVYVSPDGDDSGDGTLENMLKTPAGAQAFVRASGALGKKPVKVVFKI